MAGAPTAYGAAATHGKIGAVAEEERKGRTQVRPFQLGTELRARVRPEVVALGLGVVAYTCLVQGIRA